jgi:hemoglobin-like flavoprotein
MVDLEIQIIRDTWHSAAGKPGNDIGAVFFNELLEELPYLPSAFQDDLKEQSKKFLSVVGYLVYKLDHANLFQETRSIVQKHSIQVINEEHFDHLKQALIRSLKTKLMDRWNQDTMVAWIWFFTVFDHFIVGRQRSNI